MSITIEVSPPTEKALRAAAAAQGMEMTELVSNLIERAYAADNTASQRPYGLCAGQFRVPDDFHAPLPDDILDAFEGK